MTLIERARRWGEERKQRWLEKGIDQGRLEGFERGRLEGIELAVPEGVEQGRMAGERQLVARLVARRIGGAAAVHFLPVLNKLSEGERIRAIAQLPPHGKFADIRELDAIDSRGWMEVERKLVEQLIAEKFGPGAAENLAPVLGSPSAPDRMPAIADAVLDCGTAEEFTARIADA